MTRSLLSIVAALWAAAPMACLAASPDRPNILLIFADDLGWTDLSTGRVNYGNGNTYVQTPNLDRLAEQGLSFTNMHMNPNCAPSRASLMTGQYPLHNGVYNVASLNRGKGKLEPAVQRSQHITHEAVTIAETLKKAGYVTCQVGKYHVSEHDDITRYDGFDFNYGGGKKGDGVPHGYFALQYKDGWGFMALGDEINPFATPYTKEYIEQNLKPFANANDPSILAGTPKHLTDAEADAAIDFLTRHVASPDKDKPFFMNVAFNAVHGAVRARADLAKKYQGIASHDDRHARWDYAALTEGMDQAAARILHFLDEHHLADNTLVIFLSDNGGSASATHNDPLRGYKGMFYEGGLRDPMMMRLPKVIKPASTTDAFLYVADLYPTFAEFAGAALPDSKEHVLDGFSFAPLVRGDSTDAPRSVTYLHFPGYLDRRAFPVSVIIKRMEGNKNYKLIYSYEDQHYELYNLSDDLGEKNDLLNGGTPSPADLALASNLRDDLRHYLETTHPLMPTDRKTHEAVPLPVPLETALKAGNKITRSPSTKPGEEGGAD